MTRQRRVVHDDDVSAARWRTILLR